MADSHSRAHEQQDKRSLIQKLTDCLHPGPDSREELLSVLAQAEDRQLIGSESRVMLEGVLRIADMTAGDVMIAAPRMDLVDIQAPIE